MFEKIVTIVAAAAVGFFGALAYVNYSTYKDDTDHEPEPVVVKRLAYETGPQIGTAVEAKRPALKVGPRGVLHWSHLPSCKYEDASSGPLPCSWNFPHHHDGNGAGLSYYVTGNHGLGGAPNTHRRFHYVWPVNPRTSNVGPRVRWVSYGLADALAEGSTPHADTRNWRRCIYSGHIGRRITVVCADGLRTH